MKHYRSSIPNDAKERVLANRIAGRHKFKAEYVLKRKVVGFRQFDENGRLEFERPLRNGVTHGTLYYFCDGVVTFAEPYSNGLAHGTARQWSTDGEPIGTYAMRRGTGLDLFRARGHGRVYLSEARYIKEGKWHGFEWWLNDDQKSVRDEHHFWENLQHGIQRSWNSDGRLRRGFPRYWVRNVRVTKQKYLWHCTKDSSLPPFREQDSFPSRQFPLEVRAHCTKVH